MKIKKFDHVYIVLSLFVPVYLLTYAAVFWFEKNLSLGDNISAPPLINSMGISLLIAMVLFPITYVRFFKKSLSGEFIIVNRNAFTVVCKNHFYQYPIDYDFLENSELLQRCTMRPASRLF